VLAAAGFQRQESPFHGQALRGGKTAKLSLTTNHAVARHNQGKFILGHALPYRAGRTGRTCCLGKLSVGHDAAARNAAAHSQHASLKGCQARQIETG